MTDILVEQSNLDFSAKGLGVYPPVTRGLEMMHFLTDNAAVAAKNQAVQGSFGSFAEGVTPSFADGGLISDMLLPLITSDLTGDLTFIAVFATSSTFDSQPVRFGVSFESSPIRYGVSISAQGAVSDANYYTNGQIGTWNGVSGDGVQNLTQIRTDDLAAGELIFAAIRFNAATREATMYLRNGVSMTTPRTDTETAPSGHVRDTRNTLPAEFFIDEANSDGPGYFVLAASERWSDAEIGQIYDFVKAHLDARSISGL